MNLNYTIKAAIDNLKHSKLRTILAMLGILVGTASVVAMISCGQLATEQALAEFKVLGTNLLSVSMYSEVAERGATPKKLDIASAERFATASPEIDTAGPYISLYETASYQGVPVNAAVVGSTEDLAKIIKLEMAKGRFISFLDNYGYFCVLGSGVYDTINNLTVGSPLGKQILIGKNYFTIIGVAKSWAENSFFNQDVNNSIFIPIRTAAILNQNAQINNVVMSLRDITEIEAIEKNITHYINLRMPGAKLFFRSAKQIIESMEKQQHILTLFLGMIGSIALIVGGIGVMNIMLVSVIERRREIGIRRAIGAKRRDIQKMFLIESVILSLIGGIFGVIIGIGTSFIVATYAHWEFRVFFIPPTIGFTVSVLIGIFFGFYPAYSASRLDPIQTLRS